MCIRDRNTKELADKNNESAEKREKMKASTKPLSTNSVKGPPKSGKPQKSFESKGNDVLGGFDLERFEPK